MNVRTDVPILLLIESAETSDAIRGELEAALSDYPVVAIHEKDADVGTDWAVSFGETGWPESSDEHPWFGYVEKDIIAPLDAAWRSFPDLDELVAASAGKSLVNEFGSRVRCSLAILGDHHWSITEFEESHGRVQVGRIIVAPPWIFPDLDGSSIIIKIKPSTGFGTGHHPSTRLALSLLQQVSCEGRQVLDVGTGSGIVAIAAARLGASRVCAVDCDPDALAAAADGLQRNAVKRHVDLKQADAFVDVLGEFDLVTANLEAAQIAGGAERLLSHVRPGGQLLLSGFLTAEFDKVRGAFSQSPTLMEHDAGWTAVVLTRSADALA